MNKKCDNIVKFALKVNLLSNWKIKKVTIEFFSSCWGTHSSHKFYYVDKLLIKSHNFYVSEFNGISFISVKKKDSKSIASQNKKKIIVVLQGQQWPKFKI